MGRSLLLALLVTMFPPVLCFAGPEPEPVPAKPAGGVADTLLVLDQQWWDASSKHDVQTLARMAADDFVGFDGEQHRWTKPELLEHLKRVRTADLKRIGEREVIRLDEHAAVLTYEAEFKVYAGDQLLDTAHQRVSACWVQRDGGWFVRFSHSTNLAAPASPTQAPKAPAGAPAAVAPKTEPAAGEVAWGKPQANGLEFGAALRDGAKKAYAPGEAIPFLLKVRNPTNHVVEGEYSTYDAFYAPPTVLNAEGKPVKVDRPTVILGGLWAIIRYSLKPGEEKQLATMTLYFEPDGRADEAAGAKMIARAGAGRYKVTYPQTGTVEVEIKEQ